MVDEFGKDVIVDTLKKYDERIIFPFLTVRKLVQIVIALSLFSKKKTENDEFYNSFFKIYDTISKK